jgi:hypothetical protein
MQQTLPPVAEFSAVNVEIGPSPLRLERVNKVERIES